MLIGIVYGWVRQRTDSIIAAIITHAMANLILFIMMYRMIIPEML